MRDAGEPPAVEKIPATYRFPVLSNVSACTVLPTPLPSADQPKPFHMATRLTVPPSAVAKPPPAYKFPNESNVSANTVELMPSPSAVQLTPSHEATRFAEVAPA